MLTNTVMFAGNLTADPELRETRSGTKVANFRIAVGRRIPNPRNGEWEDRNDGFFNVVVWRNQALHVQQTLHKGDRVVVVGRMISRSYEITDDRGDTSQRWVTELEADEVCPSLRWATYRRTREEETGATPAALPEPPPEDADDADPAAQAA